MLQSPQQKRPPRLLLRLLYISGIVFVYIFTVAAFFALENAADIAGSSERTNALLKPSLLYQKAVTAGFRKLRNNYVAVILIDGKLKGIRDNLCLRRLFLAKLLDTMREKPPAVIALDMWFDPEACSDTDDPQQGTRALQRAVLDVSGRIPIVFGREAHNQSSVKETWPDQLSELKNRGFQENQLILGPTVKFEAPKSQDLSWGLVELNRDTRKIPLSWEAYSSLEAVGREQASAVETLPVAVLRAYRPDPSILKDTENLEKQGKHPFSGFLKKEELLTFSAIDVICGAAKTRIDWRNCKPGDVDAQILTKLRHRVVVIGKDDPSTDQHETVVGTLPGAVMQANYIESLLDARFLKPVEGSLSLSVGLAWFGIIELIFRRWALRPHLAVLYSILATVLVWVIVYDIALLHWGFYLVLWPPSITVIFLRYLVLLSETIAGRRASTNRG